MTWRAAIVAIPRRRGGGVRRVFIAPPAARARLRAAVSALTSRATAECPHAHGFVRGRGTRTHAAIHAGPYAATITADLRDFFASVTPTHLAAAGETAPPGALIDVAGVPDDAGAPRQGLPTSPPIACLAAGPLDRAIVAALQAECPGAAYSRYADDLAISVVAEAHISVALAVLDREVVAAGFELAPQKTRIQRSRGGRRVICGVSVGPATGDVRAPRTVRRRARAAAHQADGRAPIALRRRLVRAASAARGDPATRARAGGIARSKVAALRHARAQAAGLAAWVRHLDGHGGTTATSARDRIAVIARQWSAGGGPRAEVDAIAAAIGSARRISDIPAADIARIVRIAPRSILGRALAARAILGAWGHP